MPRCVAAGCNNNHFDSVSFHRFPKEEKLFKLWVAAVSRTRKYFTGSKHSHVCSDHFKEEDYELRSRLANELRLSGMNQKRLKKGSVPSVFAKPPRPGTVVNEKKNRRSSAYEKRERARIISNNISELEMASTPPSSSELQIEDVHEVRLGSVDVETQTEQCVHCNCCIPKQVKPKMKDFVIQLRTPMTDQGMQIFGEEDLEGSVKNFGKSKDKLIYEDKTDVIMKDGTESEGGSASESEAESEEDNDSDDDEEHCQWNVMSKFFRQQIYLKS